MRRARLVVAMFLATIGVFAFYVIRETRSVSRPGSRHSSAIQIYPASLEEPVVPVFPQQRVGWVVGQVFGVETPSLAPSHKQMVERMAGR